MKVDEKDLRKILVGGDLVDEEDFDEAVEIAERTDRDLSNVLLEKNLIEEDDLAQLVADYFDIPFVAVGGLRIPRNILDLIPEELARKELLIPFRKDGRSLQVAMSNPTDLKAVGLVRKKSGMAVKPFYASDRQIRKALKQYRKGLRQEFEKIIEENIKQAKRSGEDSEGGKSLPVVKVVDTLMDYAISEDASDIHIEPFREKVLVRYRIDGVLQDMLVFPKEVDKALVARIKIMANLAIDEHRKSQDGRFQYGEEGERYSIRVSIMPVFFGEKVVMRLLSEEARDFSLQELGLTGESLETVKTAMEMSHGMILATGPTGSGKTTTLYSMINELNVEGVNIATIEDPIEYSMDRVNQTQVNVKAGVTFASGLRSLLRQDPDIMMVGEIRDEETAEMAIHSALTGHLVFSTLHTNNAAGTLPRLLDMGVPSFLVASVVKVAIAQRLARRLCFNCISSYKLSDKQYKALSQRVDIKKATQVLRAAGVLGSRSTIKSTRFYIGEGCDQCGETGYRGRVGLYEVLEVDDKIRELILSRADEVSINKVAVQNGMMTMLQDGIQKAIEGMISLEEVLRVTQE